MKKIKRLFSVFSFAFILMVCDSEFAMAYVVSNVVTSYSNCAHVSSSGGNAVISATIHFKSVYKYDLKSRAIFVYAYKNGVYKRANILSVVLGSAGEGGYIDTPEYRMSYNDTAASWTASSDISLRVAVYHDLPYAAYDTIAIQGGNYMRNGEHVMDPNGIYFDLHDFPAKKCQMIKFPSVPVNPDIDIKVTAPDWELGEIRPGEQDISLTSSANQLCLQYTDTQVSNKAFIITASNQNGTINNRYQLQNLSDSSQRIPYQLKLDSGTSQLSLPNSGQASLPLRSGGKTCFLPTFKTSAPQGIKAGDYSDVLTFNIVTKS